MATPTQELTAEELYMRYGTALRRFVVRMLRCEEAAAEVTQEVYLRLLRFAPRRQVENARAYLFRIAANVALDCLARERTRKGIMDRAPPSPTVRCPIPDAEAVILARERLRILAEAVAELSPRRQEVFLMSRLDGLSNGQIAERLGISRNMVEKHLIKALLHCRRRVGAVGR